MPPQPRSEAVVRRLGQVAYEPTWSAMQHFTSERGAGTPDEIWLLQHPPVFTLGLAGKPEHLLRDIGVPVVKVDRGGQITYHGPGQVVAYLMLDLTRRRYAVRQLVQRIEQAMVDLLHGYGIAGKRRPGAPGVYVDDAKIAALGLRIRTNRSYHGLSLNVDMDLEPFAAINPCGYSGLKVTQLRDLGVTDSPDEVADRLLQHLIVCLE
ncbi:MAG: lipoyl(octanoyl) transferase LipB [Rhodocyclaceae bacterium]